MKIKYECTVVEKYVGCEVVTLEVCEGNRSVHPPLIFKLYKLPTSTLASNPSNPEWGKFVPGNEYFVDLTSAETL